jgi:hypothetical protein
MKKALMLCLLPALAHAGALSDTLCGANPVACHSVANSDGPPVDLLQYDYLRGHIVVTIGMARYDSGLYAVPASALSWTNTVLTDQNGNQMLLSAAFHTWSTVSGRTRLTHWELVSGSVSQ